MRIRKLASNDRYIPIDELLELPQVRVLRALQRFDSMTIVEMCEHLNEHGKSAVQALWRAAREHAVVGNVEAIHGSQDKPKAHRSYRITDRGRFELRRLLAKGEVNDAKCR